MRGAAPFLVVFSQMMSGIQSLTVSPMNAVKDMDTSMSYNTTGLYQVKGLIEDGAYRGGSQGVLPSPDCLYRAKKLLHEYGTPLYGLELGERTWRLTQIMKILEKNIQLTLKIRLDQLH